MKNKIIKKIEKRKLELLNGLINATNDNLRSVYQFKISQLEDTILTLKRQL